MEVIDLVVMGVCLAGAFGAGIISPAVKLNNIIEYALAGRRLTMPLFVVSIVATWYGAVLGVGEFVATHGIIVVFCFALPYYVAAIVYAMFLVGRFRSSDSITLPHRISSRMGKGAGLAAGILVVIMTLPAPYLLIAGEIISSFTHLGRVPAMVIVAAVSVMYLYRGGLNAGVRANVVQLFLMYMAFAGLLVWSWISFGAPTLIPPYLTEGLLSIPGDIGWSGVVVWWIAAAQTFVDPTFHQRVAACHSTRVARQGLLLSVVMWMTFDALTITTAFYGVAFAHSTDALATHLTLAAAVLPPGMYGLFVGGLLAAVLSTLDGYALTNALAIKHDVAYVLSKSLRARISIQHVLLLVMFLSILLAIVVPSAIGLLLRMASVSVPGLLLPTIIAYREKERIGGSWIHRLVLPAALSLIVMLIWQDEFYWLPMVSGILLSVVLHCKYYYLKQQ